MDLSTKLITIATIFVVCFSCSKNKEEPDACNEVQIEDVFPDNNAAQEPVLIQGEGFEENTIVRFGQVVAEKKESNENFISTIVPTGLQAVVELSVQNGENCISVVDFEVIGSLPGNLPAGPPIYAIPPAGFSFPVHVGLDETLYLRNVYDDSHRLQLFPFRQVEDDLFVEEIFKGEFYEGNGVVDLSINRLSIELSRPASQNTNENEKLVGGFYTMELEFNGTVVLDNFYLAFSEVNGRQYIFKN